MTAAQEKTMLFKTVHGSHLYGLAHEDSDDDFYVVVNTVKKNRAKYAKQSIIDGVDTTTLDWGTWVNQCQAGVPQALEAMFSQKPLYEAPGIREFRASFRTGPAMRDRYYRTIDNFLAEPNFKKNRHGLRLALNLRDGLRYGWFNPTLTAKQKVWATYHAKYTELDALRDMALNMANA